MTRLVNVPAAFATESVAAFALANADRVRHVDGGVVRRDPVSGRVAIVMGGGSGHYPAFAGWVGRGFGDAAVCGNVFSSPSEHQILEVTRAADQGGGILFLPINYAGDILHFGAARDELVVAGTDARTVVVADDIASGGPGERHVRRGIAGSLFVVKIAGAAAARGGALDDVERVARAAGEATRSFGVAFSGCVLPGSAEPLFTVPEGVMAVGMGIHGEPGIAEQAVGTASDVADVIVDGLFAERPPAAGQRVAVLVNGLGSTKYDELNLVFARVRERLVAAGMTPSAPLVGEFMTSLDMAGVSVSLAYLDDELDDLWRDPVDSVALSRGRIDASAPDDDPADAAAHRRVFAEGAPASAAAAAGVLRAAETVLAALVAEEDELGRLDAVAGDGDHGRGMTAGATAARAAVREAVDARAGAGSALRAAGESWSAVAGGTSGALWGAALSAAADAIGDEAAPDAAAVADAVEAFATAIRARGGAELGDKTMLDAVVPFGVALRAAVAAGHALDAAWAEAAEAAAGAAAQTAELAPRRGRARIHGARSVGTPDAGAVSFALVVRAAAGGRPS